MGSNPSKPSSSQSQDERKTTPPKKSQYDLFSFVKDSRKISEISSWEDNLKKNENVEFLVEDPKKGPILLYLQAMNFHSLFLMLLHRNGISSLDQIPITDMIHFQYWDACLKRKSFVCGINEIPKWVSIEEYKFTGHILIKKRGPLKLLELLIKDGLCLNQLDGKSNETILHMAVEQGNLDLVKLLLQFISHRELGKLDQFKDLGKPVFDKIDLSILNGSMKSAFMLACEGNNPAIVKAFLDFVPYKNEILYSVGLASHLPTPIEIGLKNDNVEILQLLLKNGVHVDTEIGGTDTSGKLLGSTKKQIKKIIPDALNLEVNGTPIFKLVNSLFQYDKVEEATENSIIKILKKIDIVLQEKPDMNKKFTITEYDKKNLKMNGTKTKTDGHLSIIHRDFLTTSELLSHNLFANSKFTLQLITLSIKHQLTFVNILLTSLAPKQMIHDNANSLLLISIQNNSATITKYVQEINSISIDLLLTAIKNGCVESACIKMFEILKEQKICEESDYEEILRCACENGMADLVEYILDNYKFERLNILKQSAAAAICNGYINPIEAFETKNLFKFSEIIRYLDFNENTPLHLCVNNPKLKPTQFLKFLKRLRQEVNAGRFSFQSMNNEGFTAVDLCALHSKRFDLLLCLAKEKVSISGTLFTQFLDNLVICAASSNCTSSEFKKIIKLSGGSKEVSYKNKKGITPLHIATSKNNITLMRVLLEDYHIDANVADESLNTPLHLANSEEAIKLLLNFGASPNRINSSKETKLCKIVQSSRVPLKTEQQMHQRLKDVNLAKVLLEYGADPNIQDLKGNSPIHYACLGLQAKTKVDLENHFFKLLLDYGADPTLHNNSGDTPMHLLFHRKLPLSNKKLPLLQLIQRGADVNAINRDRVKPIHLLEGRINSKTYAIIDIFIKENCNYEVTNCYNLMKDPSKFLDDIEQVTNRL